jgi:hypothetical protein
VLLVFFEVFELYELDEDEAEYEEDAYQVGKFN